ncbi:MAG: hypothetical protein CL916_11225 [Deltaproteobacteria bacterium]|nr:hypothetical protein [Deltaproteobacteria bacterium]
MKNNTWKKYVLFYILIGFLGSWTPFAYAQEDEEGGWLGGDEEETVSQEPTDGADSPEIYRSAVKEYKQLDPEEEILLWGEYVKEYPNSFFTKQIEARIQDLEVKLYEEVENEQEAEEKGTQELDFAQPQLLENIDPRKKLRFAFEMGLPNYINLLVDYEYPLRRELSVHGGLRKRYAGWSMDGGAKYSLVKSVRTKSLVTVLGDVRINTIPFFVGLRPQISAGKIFTLPNNSRLDVMGQIGTELQAYNGIQAVLIGGAHISFIASETVRIYAEANVYMKDFFWDGGAFSFNTVTFGMKFRKKPGQDQYGRSTENKFEGAIGTTVPAQYKYWRYHYGSITGDVNIY